MKIGIHLLTPYSPSNPNRDELGQPKTATIGGQLRQRISSQALKRAWRLSDEMESFVEQSSVRTRKIGTTFLETLEQAGVKNADAKKRAEKVAKAFGKVTKKSSPNTEEVVVLGHEEWQGIKDLASNCAAEKREPTDDEVAALAQATHSVDVAMFGRMRAAQTGLNVDAAVSVAHALTTNNVVIEADYWTAVDDLVSRDEDSTDRGAGGIGEREYASGNYYIYALVDFDALVKNLGDDRQLASETLAALVRAAATVTPTGHRTSFANQAYANYLRVETGDMVSPNLMLPAFEKPVSSMQESITALQEAADHYRRAYDMGYSLAEMSVSGKQGSLNEVIDSMQKELNKGAAS